jgi:2-methylcitrate dehydratase PrpD
VLTLDLAEYAASTGIEAIPAPVQERAKQIIFDEMACACFGRRSPAGDLTARYAGSIGGSAESRILGTGLRVPAPYAALANGAAGHGEEVDGAHVVGGHPGATVVPAAMALAERQRATGADLINAVVLGYDIGTRMVGACGGVFLAKQRYHLHSDFLYAVGAAAAAGRLMGLDPVRHCHAMALVTFQANGLCALFHERRHISKSFSAGQYAFAGVSAALMASIGMEGSDDILGAPHGLLEAWAVDNGWEILTHGLGEDYAVMGANFKFVNAGYPIHAAVEAATEVVRTHRISTATIAALHVGMPANALRVVDNRAMHNICVQDMLAAALVRGSLSLGESPFPAVLDHPDFLAMRGRITVGVDADLQREQPDGRGAVVAITTTSGSVQAHRIDWPKGHSRRGGVTWEDLSAKWHDALPGYDVDRALQLARGLDELDDTRVLAETYGSIP